MFDKKCNLCKVDFSTKNNNQLYCSTRCCEEVWGKRKQNECRVCRSQVPHYISICKQCKIDNPIYKKVCKNCGKRFQSNRIDKIFCKDVCYVVRNQRKYRNKLKRKCFECKLYNVNHKAKGNICKICRHNRFLKYTLREVFDLYGKYQGNNRIHDRARDSYAKDDNKYCVACGYSKHVEVCHIKAIKEFDLDTLISVINDKNNLILLCRNCHWELDHGY